MGLFRWDQGLQIHLDRRVQNAKNKCRIVLGLARESKDSSRPLMMEGVCKDTQDKTD